MKRMNRRKFLKTTGKLTLAGATALSVEPLFSGFVRDHSKVAYASDVQTGFNVYNGINPNNKETVTNTFKDCLSKGFIPGIYYKTTKPMITVAKGTVREIRKWEDRSRFLKNLGNTPKDARGYYVSINHGYSYYSFYCHLKEPKVKFGQKIKRGEILGLPDETWNLPGLGFNTEGGTSANPNNYGINHGFMTDWDGVTDLEISKEEQKKRFEAQIGILNKIAGMVEGPEKYYLLRYKHKGKDKIYKWTPIEKFRYIEYLIQNKPETFPSLTKEQFGEMKKEFYSNQPIILTLPFQKG